MSICPKERTCTKDDQEVARGRLAASVKLREAGTRWAEVITDGAEDEPGELRQLDDDCAELNARIDELEERAATYTRTADALRGRIDTIQEVIADALARLGHEPTGQPTRQNTEEER